MALIQPVLTMHQDEGDDRVYRVYAGKVLVDYIFRDKKAGIYTSKTTGWREYESAEETLEAINHFYWIA